MNYLNNFFAFESEGQVPIQAYQSLTKYIIIPQGTEKRFLIKYGTGLGKTYTALLILQNFSSIGLGAIVVSYQQELFREEIIKFNLEVPLDYFGYIELGNRLVNEIQPGYYKINRNIIKSMYNGVIVFDEVQKCYSSVHDTLQYIYVRFITLILRNRVTCVYLSATPLTYADEIREFLSLMQNHKIYSESLDDFQKIITVIQQLEQDIQANSREEFIQKAIQKLLIEQDIKQDTDITETLILDTCRNRVFYVPELLGGDVPKVNFIGQTYKDIPNLQIEICESPASFKASDKQISDLFSSKDKQGSSADIQEHAVLHESLRHIQFEGKSIQHIIKQLKQNDTNTVKWCKQNQIQLNSDTDTLEGDFMRFNNLQQYSPKFAKCIQYILTNKGKSFVYFNHVKTYGVQFICQALRENGLLEYGEQIRSDSICFNCRQSAESHNNDKIEHQFLPFRFFRITGEEGVKYKHILDIFNNASNDVGQHLQVIVGSQRVIQGFNFLAVNNSYILSFPFNMPNLIQVIGRTVRNRSHMTLPLEQQYVNIHILVNGFSKSVQDIKYASREELDIYVKCSDHQQILQYEALMHKVSVDVPIYGSRFIRDTNQSQLKRIPFTHEQDNIQPVKLENTYQLLTDQFDTKQYYISQVSRDILFQIRTLVDNRFHSCRIWNIQLLLQSIKSASVYPSLKGVSNDSILAVIYANRDLQVFGEYVGMIQQESKEQQQQQLSRSIIGKSQSMRPDIDFFLPNVGMQLTPLKLAPVSDLAIDSLKELYQYLSLEGTPFLVNLMKGSIPSQSLNQFFSKIDIKYIFNIIKQIIENKNVDIQSLILEQFVPVKLQICSEHEADIRPKVPYSMSVTALCQKCMNAKKHREQFSEQLDTLKLIFTLLTHTAVIDSDKRVLMGYLSQDHKKLYRFDSQQWHVTDDFVDSITQIPVIIKQKGMQFRYKNLTQNTQNQLKSLRCPGISNQYVQEISAYYNYSNVTSCQSLVESMWSDELFYRLHFICKKLIIWKDFVQIT